MENKQKPEEQSVKRTEIGTLGEFGLIEHLTKPFEYKHPETVIGIGDDAAVIANSGTKETLVSTDMLVEGIHFDLAYTPLKHLGFKAVSVNVSDIYAMNAVPKQITVSLAISNRFSVEALEEIYAGIQFACNHYEVDLIGGDTTSTLSGLVISVTAIGEAEPEAIVTRSGASVGDLIVASGDFGAAFMGLKLLEREKEVWKENPDMQPELEDEAYLIQRILQPYARKDAFETLQEMKVIPTAMIDVSDGLASELFHLSKANSVGIEIFEEQVPMHPNMEEQAKKFKVAPITAALSGGEDYELLFTIDPKDEKFFKNNPYFSIIGKTSPYQEGLRMHSKGGNTYPLKAQGWVHFSNPAEENQ